MVVSLVEGLRDGYPASEVEAVVSILASVRDVQLTQDAIASSLIIYANIRKSPGVAAPEYTYAQQKFGNFGQNAVTTTT